MSNVLESIKKEFERLKGQFVITQSWRIERLIAIGDDESDYYYVTYDGRKLTWNTCVGKVIPLKGKIDDQDYAEFVRIAKLNHFDQVKRYNPAVSEKIEQFIKDYTAELLTLPPSHKFLTEVCLDLN